MAQVLIKNVNKIYDNGFHAVKDANIIAEDKEFVVLVGPSGCGKTTTLRMVAGLETISSGEILIDDKIVNDVLPKDRNIAMVFQNYALYPHMSVYENMAFALKLRKMNKSSIKQKVLDAAEMLGIDTLLDRKPKQLSGGQRQRVALGRAIVRNPKVFLFDEPLSNLDAKMRVQMRAEISRLHKNLQTTMIYVTHDQIEAMTMADKIVVMKDGVIQQIASPLEIYNHPVNLFVAGFIGSPAINSFKGKLFFEKDHLYFIYEDMKITLTNKQKTALNNYKSDEIIFSIRPEDIYDTNFDSLVEEKQTVHSFCEIVEPLGNEYMVYLKIGKKEVTARFDPKKLPETNKTLLVSFDMDKSHLFDISNELCII
ncbi:MAG: sn-glycerol-3-phosphate ABC transporter ATP-binding protein UgpC [Candidatus Cloacimonadales bacterium]|jgi:multiple sugar transport system ATP-binding protein|nr:sn-glycerol-3-phosphate ABC transporter ATP-binding protein UgpC [Candidatus Cloacimonadota bacterium]MDD2650211.1 sn-glycerol-3-phosphate ABC transporter ATP-binding protein UgpC [Candidatus Cloacimonadota bacterium]MDX9977145.1 sn-glycerol-3-phosphate ABC transporter ATP-binding protein UgpC [Candidatus Cloacimonadales bacterium]